jgi:hypothetical protein
MPLGTPVIHKISNGETHALSELGKNLLHALYLIHNYKMMLIWIDLLN